jgi:hypothetical protein
LPIMLLYAAERMASITQCLSLLISLTPGWGLSLVVVLDEVYAGYRGVAVVRVPRVG